MHLNRKFHNSKQFELLPLKLIQLSQICLIIFFFFEFDLKLFN